MKAVIYARYSSDSQREESIDGQIRECTEYAERNGITILGSYVDRALSARTDDRPDFQRMIADSEKRLFDIVLVWKLDRFSRDRYDSAHYKHILKKNGVRVMSVKENISDGPEGIILESILEGYAEYYSAELSEKIQRGQTENALKCKTNGGTLPLGYCSDNEQNILIDPITAAIPIEIFTRYDNGETIKEICDELNSRGLKTRNGKKFKVNGVSIILSNRKYIGEYRYRDVVTPDGIPAIIDKDMFERVQERMAKNKRAPARKKAEDEYLLTTKLFCGKCQSMMVGESGTSHTKEVHRYYKCVSVKHNRGCDKKTVRKEWIENIVIEEVKKLLANQDIIEDFVNRTIAALNQENTVLPLLRKKFAETQKGIDNLVNAIQMGIISPSTKQRLDELEREKAELSVEIMKEEMARPTITKENILCYFEQFRKLNTNKIEHRRRLIDSFVNAIFLYDDKMVITFNYREQTKTITFADLGKSGIGSDINAVAAP